MKGIIKRSLPTALPFNVCIAIEICIIILTVGVASYFCYSQVFEFGFLAWDTRSYIVDNECIHELNLSSLQCIFSTTYFYNWHPVTTLSYAVEYHLFGEHPAPYHMTNVILHGVNGLGVYFIAKKLLFDNGFSYSAAISGALVGTLLFIVHPQHVESVAWIADRKGLLCTAFLLLSFIFYQHYAECQSNIKRRRLFVGSLIAYICALMSKPMAVTWPVLLLLLDLYPLGRFGDLGSVKLFLSKLRELLIEKITFIFLAALMCCITVYAQLADSSFVSLDQTSLELRIFNAFYFVFFYIKQWILPLELAPYYVYPASILNSDMLVICTVVGICLGITAYAIIMLMKRQSFAIVVWGFIVISLFPVIGIFQVGGAAGADRYTYFSLLPLFFLFSWGIAYIKSKLSTRVKIVLMTLVVLVLIFFSFLSRTQVKVWKSDVMLWSYVLQKDITNNLMPLISMANALHEVGDHEAALEYFVKAEALGALQQTGHYIRFARSYTAIGAFDYALQIYMFLQGRVDIDQEYQRIVTLEIEQIQMHIRNKKANQGQLP